MQAIDLVHVFKARLDQFLSFLSRARELKIDQLDCLDFQTLVHRIERIADHNTNIAKSVIALIESKMEIPEEMMSILIKAAEIAFTSYDNSVQSFLSKDVSNTNDIIDKEKEIEELFKKITPLPLFSDETYLLSHIIFIRESTKKICHYAADIAELAIDRTYKS